MAMICWVSGCCSFYVVQALMDVSDAHAPLEYDCDGSFP